MIKFSILVLLLVGCKASSESTEAYERDFSGFSFESDTSTENMGLFAGLIGDWNCTSEDLVDSVWYENKALWRWEYILGGHALLNHWWQEDNSINAPSKEYFANGIFIQNKETHQWEAVVMNSRPHKLSPKFKLELEKNQIKMHDGTGTWLVTFYGISENAFKWKYEVLVANKEWKPISKITARRKV